MKISAGVTAILALFLGFVVGALATAWHPPTAAVLLAVADPVGTLWVNAIRMTVIPLVVSLLITGVGSIEDVRSVGKLGGRALLLFAFILVGAATFTAFVAPWLFEFLTVDPVAATALRERMALPGTAMPELPTVVSWITGLIPVNPVKAAVDGAMLPLLVFTVAFALGVARLPESPREALFGFFRATGEAMLVLVRWVLWLAPLGVFALAAALGVRIGVSAAGAIGFYLVVTSLLCVVVALALYPVAVLGGRVPLRLFARAALPAQIVAATTRSSLAALPSMLDSADETLRLPRETTTFVLPLAVSILRANVAVVWIVGALFIGKLYGVELSAAAIVTIAVASVTMSFSVPGIPSGSLFILAPFFPGIGLPVEGVGILIALDTVPDIFKTGLNVTAHLTSATVLGRGGARDGDRPSLVTPTGARLAPTASGPAA
ncbi:MAG: dicarboxylate/amino acid:cation symporter [Gemmatimonadaceae bacterium]